MAIPATTGQLRTNINDMEIGDYIVCDYKTNSTGAIGTFSNFGGTAKTEISVNGSIPTVDGSFYFVKVNKGLLIADRVIQTSISWDNLNSGKVIQGKPQTLGSTNGVIRSLTGGVGFADLNGNLVFNAGDYGAFPSNNEFDKYINGFPIGKIAVGKTINDIFHHKTAWTWTQDTQASGTNTSKTGTTSTMNNTVRAVRAENSLGGQWSGVGGWFSNTTDATGGFRPVFEYREQ